MPRIPLIEDLATNSIPPGSNIIVEYEPASQWFTASVTVAAGWLKQNGKVSYNAMAQSPARIREALNRLGIDYARLEAGPQDYERLRIWDFYTSTLGLKSNEKLQAPSLKVAEISIFYVKEQFKLEHDPGRLTLVDDWSSYSRFNDERSWVEFILTRDFPVCSRNKWDNIGGLLKGIHSGWVYNRLEAAADGIIDFKVEEEGRTLRDMIRIRTMRSVHFDREWHELKIGENFEVTLEK
jgi:KaiC/GvpD/RAD55 family RecA-like ATPase